MLTQDQFNGLAGGESPFADLFHRLHASLKAVCLKVELLRTRLAPIHTLPPWMARGPGATHPGAAALGAAMRQLDAEERPIRQLLDDAQRQQSRTGAVSRLLGRMTGNRIGRDRSGEIRNGLAALEDVRHRRARLRAVTTPPRGRPAPRQDAFDRQELRSRAPAAAALPGGGVSPRLGAALEKLEETFAPRGRRSRPGSAPGRAAEYSQAGKATFADDLFTQSHRSAEALSTALGAVEAAGRGVSHRQAGAATSGSHRPSTARIPIPDLRLKGCGQDDQQRRERQEQMRILRRLLADQHDIKEAVEKPLDLSLGP